jgi:hypothetical protein
VSGEPIADPPAGEARSRQLPGLAFAKRPVLFVDEDHVDHDVVRAYAELAGEFVGNLPEIMMGNAACRYRAARLVLLVQGID